MLTMTNVAVTREHVWTACRRPSDVRRRERYYPILLLLDGNSGLEIAPWRSRDEETVRAWVHACNEAGLRGLERAPIPGRPA